MKNYSDAFKTYCLIFLFLLGVGCSSDVQILQVGQKLPDFTLPALDKSTDISLSDFKGKVVLIRFWTVDCTACAKEMPELEEIYQNYKDKGLSIAGINVRQPDDVIKKFISHLSVAITYPIILDTYGKTYKKYALSGVPTTIIVDRDGTIKEKILGEMDKKTLEQILVNLL